MEQPDELEHVLARLGAWDAQAARLVGDVHTQAECAADLVECARVVRAHSAGAAYAALGALATFLDYLLNTAPGYALYVAAFDSQQVALDRACALAELDARHAAPSFAAACVALEALDTALDGVKLLCGRATDAALRGEYGRECAHAALDARLALGPLAHARDIGNAVRAFSAHCAVRVARNAQDHAHGYAHGYDSWRRGKRALEHGGDGDDSDDTCGKRERKRARDLGDAVRTGVRD